ncbi:MAG TPA: hypothetical protein VGC82_21775 [Rhodopila sp.]
MAQCVFRLLAWMQVGRREQGAVFVPNFNRLTGRQYGFLAGAWKRQACLHLRHRHSAVQVFHRKLALVSALKDVKLVDRTAHQCGPKTARHPQESLVYLDVSYVGTPDDQASAGLAPN